MENAVDIASNKIEAAAPVIEKATSQTFAKVAPIALEKLQDITCNIDTVVNTVMVKAQKNLKNIHLDLSNLPAPNTFSFNFDSSNFAAVTKDALLNELNKEISKKDWAKMLVDIQNAKNEIGAMDKEKILSATVSNQVSNVLKATLDQLEQYKKNNLEVINLQSELESQQKGNEQKTKESKKQLNEKIRVQKRMEERFGPSVKVLKTYSDIQDEDQTAYLNQTNDYSQEPDSSNSIFIPVQFNSSYNYNLTDSALTSAIIIVKHNPANDSSHTKHITVELMGNNGTCKTLEFTVDVYQ